MKDFEFTEHWRSGWITRETPLICGTIWLPVITITVLISNIHVPIRIYLN